MNPKSIFMLALFVIIAGCDRQNSPIKNCTIRYAFSSQILSIESSSDCQNIYKFLNSTEVNKDDSILLNLSTEFTIRIVLENELITVFKIDKEGFFSKNESSKEIRGSVDLKYYEYIEKIYKGK